MAWNNWFVKNNFIIQFLDIKKLEQDKYYAEKESSGVIMAVGKQFEDYVKVNINVHSIFFNIYSNNGCWQGI